MNVSCNTDLSLFLYLSETRLPKTWIIIRNINIHIDPEMKMSSDNRNLTGHEFHL
jgi:hypothetical protein